MVEFYLLTFSRFPLRKKEHKSYFGKNRTRDFRTSTCAGYLLDHSGDEGLVRRYIRRMAATDTTTLILKMLQQIEVRNQQMEVRN